MLILCPAPIAGRFCVTVYGDTTIGKGRFRPPQKETGKRLRINDQIRISPVRLIDDENEQIGVVELDDAKRRAQDAGLDLVEVSPGSRPPVCRVMDYGKWKYAQRKKEQKAKSHSKQSELKGMRLRPKIDDHDLNIKVNKARDFLEDGDKVQFVMLFKGREMAHRDIGMKTMQGVCETLQDVSKIEQPPRFQGRRMTMVLTPDRKTHHPVKPKQEQPKADEPEKASQPEQQPEPAEA